MFDPEGSWVMRDRASHALVGVILCSKVAGGVAHVTQICVASSLRGMGLGKHLLAHCMEGLRARGCSALTLTVSEDNHSALALYKAAGFTTRLRFEALVLDKAPAPGGLKGRPGEASQALPAGTAAVAAETPSGAAGFFSFARRKATPARN